MSEGNTNGSNGLFLDLDSVLPSPRTVRINGEDHYITGGLPVQDSLEFFQKWDKLGSESNPESVREMLNQLAKFFLPYDNTMTGEKLGSMITMSQLPTLIRFIFNTLTDVPEGMDKKKETVTSEIIK